MLTLSIRILNDATLSFGFFSIDPLSTVNNSQFDLTMDEASDEVLREECDSVLQSLRGLDQKEIDYRLRLATRRLVPSGVIQCLQAARETFLYIDLDEKLACFPWELITLGNNLTPYQKFHCGRGVRLSQAAPAQNQIASIDPEFIIVANPDGTLAKADTECRTIRGIVKDICRPAILRQMGPQEFFPAIENSGILHFSGHADGCNLILRDGQISAEAIIANGTTPFFAFLNACGSGNPGLWLKPQPSLVRAFLLGGTKILLAPMEIVDDEAAAVFAAAFYSAFVSNNQSAGSAFSHALNQPYVAKRGMVPYLLYGNPLFRLPLAKSSAPSQSRPSPDNTPQKAAAAPSSAATPQNLPKVAATKSKEPAQKPATHSPAARKAKSREKSSFTVIILEPQVPLARAIKNALAKQGIKKMVKISNYRDGLRYIMSEQVDLIVCDQDLGDASGTDLLRVIRNTAQYANIPFIFLGTSGKDEVTFAAVWEVESYLIKPVSQEDIEATIKKAVQNLRHPNPYGEKVSAAIRNLEFGQLTNGLEIISEAIDLFPDRPRAIVHKAEILHALGQTSEATALLNRVIAAQPKYFRSYEVLGQILLAQGALTEALEAFEEELKHYPAVYERQASRRVQIANLLSEQGQYAEALQHLKAALKADSKSTLVLAAIVKTYLRLQNLPDALKFLKKIKNTNHSKDLLVDLSRVALETGQTKAVIDYLKIMRVNQRSNHEYAFLLARIYKAQDADDEALSIIKQLPASCQDPRFKVIEGAIYFLRKQWPLAESCYKAVVAAMPERKNAIFRYAYILQELGRSREAFQYLEELNRRYPSDTKVRELLRITGQATLATLNPYSPEAKRIKQCLASLPASKLSA